MTNQRPTCIICGSGMELAFDDVALAKYSFNALSCINCGFLQVEDPFWLAEAYANPIAHADTGLVSRNIFLSKKISPLLFYLFGVNGTFADLAGGTGLLVRLMRDVGFEYYWDDPYSNNTHARGFEYNKVDKICDAFTAFELLEHIQDPVQFLRDSFSRTGARMCVLTTELFDGEPPPPREWWYYAFEVGQHISFYQSKTLQELAKTLNMRFISNGFLHVICDDICYEKTRIFFSSRFIRIYSAFKARSQLKSRTMSDHLSIIGREST